MEFNIKVNIDMEEMETILSSVAADVATELFKPGDYYSKKQGDLRDKVRKQAREQLLQMDLAPMVAQVAALVVKDELGVVVAEEVKREVARQVKAQRKAGGLLPLEAVEQREGA